MLARDRRAMERAQVRLVLVDPEPPLAVRPATRAGCLPGGENAVRPCPFVSCKYHLFLDVSEIEKPDGFNEAVIRFNFPAEGAAPALEVWELGETCALDVAEQGGATLEEVGGHINVTRERIRQIQDEGVAKLKELSSIAALVDYCAEGHETWDARAEFRAVATP